MLIIIPYAYHLICSEFPVFCILQTISPPKQAFFQEDKIRRFCKKGCTKRHLNLLPPLHEKSSIAISCFEDKVQRALHVSLKTERYCYYMYYRFYSWFCKSLTSAHQSLLLQEKKTEGDPHSKHVSGNTTFTNKSYLLFQTAQEHQFRPNLSLCFPCN